MFEIYNRPDDSVYEFVKINWTIFEELKIQSVELIAVSKGKLRNSENEIFYNFSGEKIYIKKSEPIFYYMLRLRDEAHRYAITNHRIKRNKNILDQK